MHWIGKDGMGGREREKYGLTPCFPLNLINGCDDRT